MVDSSNLKISNFTLLNGSMIISSSSVVIESNTFISGINGIEVLSSTEIAVLYNHFVETINTSITSSNVEQLTIVYNTFGMSSCFSQNYTNENFLDGVLNGINIVDATLVEVYFNELTNMKGNAVRVASEYCYILRNTISSSNLSIPFDISLSGSDLYTSMIDYNSVLFDNNLLLIFDFRTNQRTKIG